MDQTEKRAVENRLMAMGLSKLDDPNLIPMMAMLIPGHEVFQGMLGSCDVEKRREMYEALKPHLMFEPKPLDTYINNLKARADAVASASDPVVVGKKKYRETSSEHSTGCVITVTCKDCPRIQRFHGQTPVDAVIKARKAGWVRDLGKQHEVCAKCYKISLRKVN